MASDNEPDAAGEARPPVAGAVGASACGDGQVACRELASIAELDACEDIQRRAFGYADIDIVPTNELRSIQKAGGLVVGAFAPEHTRPVGFCFGLVGRDHQTGDLYHASRMVAVLPEERRHGVALALKLKQRELCLRQGLTRMRWTFDPLQLKNALLNLGRLGAVGVRYHRDLFGDATTSPLHLGIGTDRLEVLWDLGREPGPLPAKETPPSGAALIEFPVDIGYLQRDLPESALAWRLRVRDGLEAALAEGRVAVAVWRNARGTPHYVMVPPVPAEESRES